MLEKLKKALDKLIIFICIIVIVVYVTTLSLTNSKMWKQLLFIPIIVFVIMRVFLFLGTVIGYVSDEFQSQALEDIYEQFKDRYQVFKFFHPSLFYFCFGGILYLIRSFKCGGYRTAKVTCLLLLFILIGLVAYIYNRGGDVFKRNDIMFTFIPVLILTILKCVGKFVVSILETLYVMTRKHQLTNMDKMVGDKNSRSILIQIGNAVFPRLKPYEIEKGLASINDEERLMEIIKDNKLTKFLHCNSDVTKSMIHKQQLNGVEDERFESWIKIIERFGTRSILVGVSLVVYFTLVMKYCKPLIEKWSDEDQPAFKIIGINIGVIVGSVFVLLAVLLCVIILEKTLILTAQKRIPKNMLAYMLNDMCDIIIFEPGTKNIIGKDTLNFEIAQKMCKFASTHLVFPVCFSALLAFLLQSIYHAYEHGSVRKEANFDYTSAMIQGLIFSLSCLIMIWVYFLYHQDIDIKTILKVVVLFIGCFAVMAGGKWLNKFTSSFDVREPDDGDDDEV